MRSLIDVKSIGLAVMIVFTISTHGVAQNSLNAETFFRNAASQLDQWQVQASSSNQEVKFPWIEQYEFRTETRDFNIEEQEYTLRVSPNTPQKRKAQQALSQHFANKPQFEVQKLRCDAFLDFHVDWTSLYLIEQHIKLLKQLQVIYDDKDLVFEKMLNATEMPIDKIIDHEADQTQLQYSLNELKLQKEQLLGRYGYEDVALNFDNFIGPDQMVATVNNRRQGIEQINMNELAYERDEIQKELDLEMARKKQYFDFAQLRYQGPQTDLLSERVSLSVAFQIPNSGRRKLRVQELQIRQQKLELEHRQEEQEITDKLEQTTSQIVLSISRHQRYQELRELERAKLTIWADKLSQRADASPISLLEIEERHIETLVQELNLLEDVLDDYLAYLNRSEQICTERNHLGR